MNKRTRNGEYTHSEIIKILENESTNNNIKQKLINKIINLFKNEDCPIDIKLQNFYNDMYKTYLLNNENIKYKQKKDFYDKYQKELIKLINEIESFEIIKEKHNTKINNLKDKISKILEIINEDSNINIFLIDNLYNKIKEIYNSNLNIDIDIIKQIINILNIENEINKSNLELAQINDKEKIEKCKALLLEENNNDNNDDDEL